jgi:hypothetical protein
MQHLKINPKQTTNTKDTGNKVGINTHIQDQWIIPHNFRTMKTNSNKPKNPIPLLDVAVAVIICFCALYFILISPYFL